MHMKRHPGVRKLKGSSYPVIFSPTIMNSRCLMGLISCSIRSLVGNLIWMKNVLCSTLHGQINAQTGNKFSLRFLVAVWVSASLRPPTLWSHETALACLRGLKVLTVPLQFTQSGSSTFIVNWASRIMNIAVQEDFYLMLSLANISSIHLQTFPFIPSLCTDIKLGLNTGNWQKV